MDIETLQALATMLAATDIDCLEIDGPGLRVRLLRDGAAAFTTAAATVAAPASPLPAAPRAAKPAATAPMPGVFLHRHPQQAAPLAAPGDAVATGQPIAFVQAGLLLLPVTVPAGATTLLAWAAEHGSTVGYGDTLASFC